MPDNKEILFKKVVHDNKDRLHRLSKGFCGNSADADDLFQEILIRIWSSIDSFRNESHINTWVYRVATNTALMYKKSMAANRKRTDNSHKEYTTIVLESDVDTKHQNEVMMSKLFSAIAMLKEVDRLIVTMLLEDMSYNDIATITGLKPSNVGARINRLKVKLSEIINTL